MSFKFSEHVGSQGHTIDSELRLDSESAVGGRHGGNWPGNRPSPGHDWNLPSERDQVPSLPFRDDMLGHRDSTAAGGATLNMTVPILPNSLGAGAYCYGELPSQERG